MPAQIIQADSTPFNTVAIDPVTLEVIENALRNARIEMDATLVRTAMSPGIREQGDAFPLIADHTVFIANAADEVTALDLATGTVRWHTPLDPAGFQWGNATIGTPAYAHGILIVPTLYRDVVALDATTGAELWRHAALPSPLRTTHYRGAGEAGYESSPVIAGDTVWIADTSGELAALDLRTGAPTFRANIGAPVLAGLAIANDHIIVASFDGTVRSLPPSEPPFVTAPSCAATPSGCSTTTPDLLVAFLVAAFVVTRSRRC